MGWKMSYEYSFRFKFWKNKKEKNHQVTIDFKIFFNIQKLLFVRYQAECSTAEVQEIVRVIDSTLISFHTTWQFRSGMQKIMMI